jgi:hypothetical protein
LKDNLVPKFAAVISKIGSGENGDVFSAKTGDLEIALKLPNIHTFFEVRKEINSVNKIAERIRTSKNPENLNKFALPVEIFWLKNEKGEKVQLAFAMKRYV